MAAPPLALGHRDPVPSHPCSAHPGANVPCHRPCETSGPAEPRLLPRAFLNCPTQRSGCLRAGPGLWLPWTGPHQAAGREAGACKRMLRPCLLSALWEQDSGPGPRLREAHQAGQEGRLPAPEPGCSAKPAPSRPRSPTPAHQSPSLAALPPQHPQVPQRGPLQAPGTRGPWKCSGCSPNSSGWNPNAVSLQNKTSTLTRAVLLWGLSSPLCSSQARLTEERCRDGPPPEGPRKDQGQCTACRSLRAS